MKTLEMFSKETSQVPVQTTWYLTDISFMQGIQELYKKQVPQKLNLLREHALVESAVSSNRIEGVEIDKSRIGTLILGKSVFRDRNEEEVQGYRNALNLIHSQMSKLSISENIILKLHQLCRGEIWDAGKYKERDIDIIQKYPNGRQRIRFKTVSHKETPVMMENIFSLWHEKMEERVIHPLILMGALNLDFLCIHPFRDGNGRVSRLLFLLNCYHLGIDVGKFISLERLIEDRKERYYEVLEESSVRWNEGKHDPWHYINFLLSIICSAYKEFKERISMINISRGVKTDIVLSVIKKQMIPFSVIDIQMKCPDISADMIRHILKQLKAEGKVRCLKRGKYARWENIN